MKCNKCGTENYDDALFCGYCGAKMAAEPAPAPQPESKPQSRKSGSILKTINIVLYFALTYVILAAFANGKKTFSEGSWWFCLIVLLALINISHKHLRRKNGQQ